MSELLTIFLKNLGCSRCQEFEFHETKDDYKGWKLYLKEYEMYTAMILYNEKLEKDVSSIISKDDNIILLNDKDEVYIKLEYIANSEENDAILVPTDEYQELYETIEKMDKKLNKKLNAYYIGIYNIKKVVS